MTSVKLKKGYVSEEFNRLFRISFAPAVAMGGCVKDGIRRCATVLGCSYNRVRNLTRARAVPSVEEMDTLRGLAGLVLVPAEQVMPEPKADLSDRIHSMVRDLHDRFIAEPRARRQKAKSIRQKPVLERIYGDRA